MGNVVRPECAAPPFLVDSLETAVSCGRFNGLLLGLFLAALAALFSVTWARDRKKAPAETALLAGGAGAVAVLVPFLLGGYVAGQRWKSARLELEAYEKLGMTPQEAVAQLQRLYEQSSRSAATLAAGANIAEALRESRSSSS